MSVKSVYYRDGLCPQIVVRHSFGDGEAVAEVWDYKDKKWVPDAGAWDTIHDSRGNWRLPEENVEGYIEKMIEMYPWVTEQNVVAKAEGARKVQKK